ncbi:MAG TPA: hypothetical protein VNK04_11275 [Gemmataceae bacterium]|nr:hypothetical protein [Gemmataceae bacterium]
MSLQITCPTCRRKLRVRDELEGKRIKCPGCARTLAVPPPASKDDADVEDTAAVVDERPRAGDRRTPRSKKRQSERGRRAEPLLILGGIEFTVGKLLAGAALIVIIVLVFVFSLGAFFSPTAEAQAVDVYTPITGFRDTAVGARLLQSKTTAYSIPGHKKLIVTRPNPKGQYLLVTVRVSSKEIDRYFAGHRGPVSLATLRAEHLQLQSGSETLAPLYVQDQNPNGRLGYHFSWTPPEREGYVPNLRDLREHLGPGPQGWTHEGRTKEEGATITFEGNSGMSVKTVVGDKRLDGSEDRNVLSDLTGGVAKFNKDLGAGLVKAPAAYVLVTWDQQSTGWMLDGSIEQPNDLSLTWTIQCFFPRPKDGGKEAKLIVLGKPRNLRIR